MKKCGLLKFCAAASLLLALGSVAPKAVYAQAKQLSVRGSLQHINGVNLPWVVNSGGSNYGHDLGPNHFTGYGYHYVGGDMDAYFADIKNMHANVVRIWLFENLEGLNFDGNGYVSGIDSTFLANLNDMIARANNHGLAVYLTLFTHDLGNQFGHTPHDGGGAVRNFFSDSGAQTALINNVVKPLAQQENGKQGVFAYDLLNEANYTVSPYSGITASATWPQIHSYVYNLAQAIHSVSSAIQVSCSTDDASSFTSANIYSRFGGVGLNFYDYHSYSDNPSLWTLGTGNPYPSINLPLLLGEFGPSTQGNATIQANATDAFINQASYQGWAGAAAWEYDTSGQNALSVITGVGYNGSTQYWKNAAWKIEYYGVQYGL